MFTTMVAKGNVIKVKVVSVLYCLFMLSLHRQTLDNSKSVIINNSEILKQIQSQMSHANQKKEEVSKPMQSSEK